MCPHLSSVGIREGSLQPAFGSFLIVLLLLLSWQATMMGLGNEREKKKQSKSKQALVL